MYLEDRDMMRRGKGSGAVAELGFVASGGDEQGARS
jgi:hypothetical protein